MKPRNCSERYFRFWAICLALILSLAAAGPATAACPTNQAELDAFIAACAAKEEGECGDDVVTCNGRFQMELISVVRVGSQVTFNYCATKLDSGSDLSHLVLQLGCPPSAVICNTSGCAFTDADPTTGIGGWKFDSPPAGNPKCFSITIDEDLLPDDHVVNIGCIPFVIKAGAETLANGDAGFGCVAGPVCGPPVNEPPICELDGPTTFCEGDEALIYTTDIDGAENLTIQWSICEGDATIDGADDEEILVVNPGTGDFRVCLTITDTETELSSDCFIDVTDESIDVSIEVDVDGTLTCDNVDVELCAEASIEGATFEWYKDGELLEGETEACITVTEPGLYKVVATDPEFGCEAEDEVEVEQDIDEPVVDLDGGTLTCDVTSIELCAETDATPVSYAWTLDGETIVDADEACIEVSEPGEYCVTVTRTDTGCATTECATVDQDIDEPVVNLDGGTLTCDITSLELCAETDVVNASYAWTKDGEELEGEDGACIDVDEAGEYCVTVTNLDNGCSTTECATVDGDGTAPEVDLNSGTLTCDEPGLELCAETDALNVSYAWTKDGEELEGEDGACIDVDEAGEYCVTVTNLDNGCSTTECVTVDADQDAPTCEIEAPAAPPLCDSEGNELTVIVTGDAVSIEWEATCPGWEITSGADTDTITYTAGPAGSSCTFTVTVTGANGCSSTCQITIRPSCPGDVLCSFTPGFWGSPNGRVLIPGLLEGDDLVVGIVGERSITFTADRSDCLNDALPGGGKPAALPSNLGDTSFTANCQLSLPARNVFKNSLLSHTISAMLNARFDSNLGDWELCEEFLTQGTIVVEGEFELDPGPDGILGNEDDPIFLYGISGNVLDALDNLGLPKTVAGLIELANRALGGDTDLGGASYSELTGALTAINEGFDECTFLLGCIDEQEED